MEMKPKNDRGKVIAWWVGILLAYLVCIFVWNAVLVTLSIVLILVYLFLFVGIKRVNHWGACVILGLSVLAAHLCGSLFAPTRDVDTRIARAKSEVARVTEKYGENGKLPVMAWVMRPEVALPPVLALLEEELAEYGIKRDEQIAAIEAAPEKFRIAVPEHWRKRFMLLTPEQERAMGDRRESKLISNSKIYRDATDEARVNRIAERLWKVLPEGTPHRIILVDDDEVNAFCFANGTVCINSGTLKQISSDDVIAFLLAHEYAHYLARHPGERVTKRLIALAGDVLAERKQMDMENEGKILSPLLLRLGYNEGSYAGVYLPFTRRMENEADTLGIRYMSRAGFDPNGAIEFFAQQDKLSGIPGWERFLSTHPTDRKRLDRMRKECAKIKRAKKKEQ